MQIKKLLSHRFDWIKQTTKSSEESQILASVIKVRYNPKWATALKLKVEFTGIVQAVYQRNQCAGHISLYECNEQL